MDLPQSYTEESHLEISAGMFKGLKKKYSQALKVHFEIFGLSSDFYIFIKLTYCP